MDLSQQLICKTRAEWREWLEKNQQTENEIWLVFFK